MQATAMGVCGDFKEIYQHIVLFFFFFSFLEMLGGLHAVLLCTSKFI